MAGGRRGHSIVCQTAAAVIAARVPDGAYLKKHSFDLSVYCNVPDLVWKKPATYAIEAPQHFMDLEIFERIFAKAPHGSASSNSPLQDPFALSRAEFEKAYPDIPVSAGRSYWRIRELTDVLHETAETLRKPLVSGQAPSSRFGDQEKWLITAGAIGHYVGDLSQPLHVTEDYDGQLENQKGIHAFFEDQVVDELSSTDNPAHLEAEVGALTLAKWAKYREQAKDHSTLKIIEDLARESGGARAELLKIDKRVGRSHLKKAACAYEPMIKARLAAGALALALIWSREVAWPYDGEKFYNFTGAPDYIYPPTASSVGAVSSSTGASNSGAAFSTRTSSVVNPLTNSAQSKPADASPVGPTPKP